MRNGCNIEPSHRAPSRALADPRGGDTTTIQVTLRPPSPPTAVLCTTVATSPPPTAPQAAHSPTRGVARQRQFRSLYPRPVIEPQLYAPRPQNRPLPPRPKPRGRRPAGWRYNDHSGHFIPAKSSNLSSMLDGCKIAAPGCGSAIARRRYAPCFRADKIFSAVMQWKCRELEIFRAFSS